MKASLSKLKQFVPDGTKPDSGGVLSECTRNLIADRTIPYHNMTQKSHTSNRPSSAPSAGKGSCVKTARRTASVGTTTTTPALRPIAMGQHGDEGRPPTPPAPPAAPTLISGIPDYSAGAQPARILGEALTLEEGEVMPYLVRHLRHRGWSPRTLDRIDSDDIYEDWIIERMSAQANLSEFTFQQWEALELAHMNACAATDSNSYPQALACIRWAEGHWTSPIDRRRVRFYLLGQIWWSLQSVASVVDTLSDWFADFGSQPEAEREVLRQMWHNTDEQVQFDALPSEILIHRGGLMPTMMAGFSYTMDYPTARMASGFGSRVFDHDFQTPGRPHIISRRVPKSTIIGLKNGSPYYGDACLDVVGAPCLAGKPVTPLD